MDPPKVKEDFVDPFTGDGHNQDENVPEATGEEDESVPPTVNPRKESVAESSSDASRKSRSSKDKPPSLTKTETAHDEGVGVVEKLHTLSSKVHSAAHKFHLDHIKAEGVTRFLNPTNIHMKVRFGSDTAKDNDDQVQQAKELALLWRSRDNRKGRNSIAVPSIHDVDEPTFLPIRYTPRMKATVREICQVLWLMFTSFPYWDMAFWSGFSYTIGSALFIIDGVMAWGPVAYGEEWGVPEYGDTYIGPLSFFIGALFYQVGAVMAYLEAVNDGSFHGSAMRRLLDGHEEDQRKMLDDKIHGFFSHITHRRHDEKGAEVDPEAGWRTKEERHLRPGSIYPNGTGPAPRRGAVDLGGEEGSSSTYATWRWYPSWHAIRTHHVYEIGWLACTIQLFGVTLYGVTAIVIIPGILSSLSWWQTLAAFWVPQVVAASCFLIASLMFMLETQEKWWKPEFGVLGWWVGAWATVGSVGFILIAAFGFRSNNETWAEYQSDLATIWGSSAYFLCSFLQWYEAMNKNPVEEMFNEKGEMKSYQIHPI